MKKELYVFRIGAQTRKSDESSIRNEVIRLLEIAPIYFELKSASEGDGFVKELMAQSFTFETQEEARQFALKILRTGFVFFCGLRSVEVK